MCGDCVKNFRVLDFEKVVLNDIYKNTNIASMDSLIPNCIPINSND